MRYLSKPCSTVFAQLRTRTKFRQTPRKIRQRCPNFAEASNIMGGSKPKLAQLAQIWSNSGKTRSSRRARPRDGHRTMEDHYTTLLTETFQDNPRSASPGGPNLFEIGPDLVLSRPRWSKLVNVGPTKFDRMRGPMLFNSGPSLVDSSGPNVIGVGRAPAQTWCRHRALELGSSLTALVGQLWLSFWPS